MSFLDTIMTEENIKSLSKASGIDASSVKSLAEKVLPAILGGMKEQSSTEIGAKKMSSLISSENVSNALNEIFGSNVTKVIESFSSENGVSSTQVKSFMTSLTKIVSQYLGKASSETSASGSSSSNSGTTDVASLIQSVVGGDLDLDAVAKQLLTDKDGDGKPDIFSKVKNLFGFGK